jgi:hypothetical protein
MAEVIREYGTAILAAVGGLLLFGMIADLFLSGDGVVVQMVQIWGNGGC